MMFKLLSRMLLLTSVLMLSACWGDDKTGPEDIAWDRDVCELCRMFLSDPRFVAEVRGGPKQKLYKFDDIGCAVNWLNEQDWAGEESVEFWVAGEGSNREKVNWIDARTARYVKGGLTPMNYGLSAIAATPSGDQVGIDFIAMTTAILADAPNHICKTPERHE